MGIALAFSNMPGFGAGSDESTYLRLVGASISVGLLLCGMVVFIALQRRGLFTGLLSLLRRCGIRVHFIESREETLRALDLTIIDFYNRARQTFFLSVAAFFLGWLAEALEVYVMLCYIGPSPDFLTAISVCALAVMIKGGTFFIPGSVGAQEGGNLVLLMAYGYSDVAGITFAILRRVRELVWIGIGLLCMAAIGGRDGTERLNTDANPSAQ
jgi:hypothetical protein